MSADGNQVFRRRTAILLAVVATLSLLGALVVAALSHELTEDASAGADAFSRSALGHHAFVRWLRASGVGVVVSRDRSASKSGPGAPLIVSEPTLLAAGQPSREGVPLTAGLGDMIREARSHGAPIVVVLPKWVGTPMPDHDGWIDSASLMPSSDVADVLGAAAGSPVSTDTIVRPRSAAPARWQSALARESLPTLSGPQLLRPGAEIEALVWNEDGILLGRTTGNGVYVLSDPDLLNTSGLARGSNALVVADLLAELGHPRSIVLDETLHGFGRPPSLVADLLRFPLLLVTLHVVALTLLALWATMGRFGKALPLPSRLPPGKQVLVDSTAELLGSGGHQVSSLEQYFRMSVRRAAAACALPPGLVDQDPIAELAALGRARGLTHDLETLAREVAEAEQGRVTARHCVAVALKIHRFCEDIAHADR